MKASDTISLLDTYLSMAEPYKRKGFNYNPLHLFPWKETLHSNVLADILDPRGSHGQGDKFIKLFLEHIKFPYSKEDKWIATAEIGSVDILLSRYYPTNAAVIIENKSHAAVDQSNQLYRYWHREVYRREKGQLEEGRNYSDKYRILYVGPEWKSPVEESCLKPEDDYYSACKVETIWESFFNPQSDILFFKTHITEWLDDCIKTVDLENVRLRTFLEFYKEICSEI